MQEACRRGIPTAVQNSRYQNQASCSFISQKIEKVVTVAIKNTSPRTCVSEIGRIQSMSRCGIVFQDFQPVQGELPVDATWGRFPNIPEMFRFVPDLCLCRSLKRIKEYKRTTVPFGTIGETSSFSIHPHLAP